ncbi:DUF4259 domain-containing protein [Nocardioides sp. P5_C9_2]
MGSWGMDPFDNDDAGDWSWTLEDGAGPEAVRDALAAAVAPSPDESTAAQAVAAAALVAAARGVPVVLPDAMREWLDAQTAGSVGALATEAVAALESVLSGSDLADTWDEQGPAWREQTVVLRDAIAAAG